MRGESEKIWEFVGFPIKIDKKEKNCKESTFCRWKVNFYLARSGLFVAEKRTVYFTPLFY